MIMPSAVAPDNSYIQVFKDKKAYSYWLWKQSRKGQRNQRIQPAVLMPEFEKEPTSSRHDTGDVPLHEKYGLTVKEAARYFGIGENNIRKLTEGETSPYAVRVGEKRLIRREALEQYLNSQYSI